ncbi:hypothetical protein [Methylorubrum extorquens]|uniref:Anti-sigma factor NepR domain-containing protein n=1 Tax=Methylorubrum extorquens (strain ATCC 14718 / DSM 1338 / JCM 2805 / NCIMB 9133 / AM1) TaxID=272630 RepID=C5B547_METEA|nr:hypothetical protein [Methylorubrum extorquens]ACS43579.1 hypothetical protein MexAM1_META2p0735 [Methylorubrum extorquens AM1]MCP1546617.1 hypothetical protein [Methylorubrum extorquens]MCP1591284.1 hypothetical protein [Methylorubrum extorquens]
MTAEGKGSRRPETDGRPKLGRVAALRIGAALRDVYADQARQADLPSGIRNLIEKLEQADAGGSASA